MTGLETELSRFAVELEWESLPARVRDRVIDIWADAVANALAGRRAATTSDVERLALRLCGPGGATVIGGGTSSPTCAALLNGYQITAYTMCDVYRPALCHVTPEVVPAVLATGEERGVDGREFLTALAIGLEVTARLGLGIDYPAFRARGWHAPGVIGTIGAAVAAARVLGLDDRGVRAAMGLGMSQAAGTFAALGTPAVKFHQGRGAVSALWAARFSAAGLGGSERALTHEDGGLFATYTGGGNAELVSEGLGDRWELERISLRRWPAASSLQSLVAVLLDVADKPTSVEIALPPTAYTMCADMGWQSELSAMQSARYVAAVVLHDGRCWTGQFSADRRADPAVGEFARNRVAVRVGADLPPSGVEVRLEFRGGEATVLRREGAPGEPGEPVTRAQIREKLGAAGAGDGIGGLVLDPLAHPTPVVCAALREAPSAPIEGSGREHARQH